MRHHTRPQQTHITALLAVFLMASSPPMTELGRFSASDYNVQTMESTHGVAISMQDASPGKPAALILRHNGAGRRFVPIMRLPREALRDGRWLLNASADVDETTQAGLGIRYFFGDDAPISSWEGAEAADRTWYYTEYDNLNPKMHFVQLPWYTVPDRVELGWVFDGPGEIRLESMTLRRRPIYYAGFGTTSLPLATGVLAGLVLWVTLSLLLARRRVLVKTTAACQMVLSQCFRVAAILGFLGWLISPAGFGNGPLLALFITGTAGALLLKASGFYLTAKSPPGWWRSKII